VKYPNYKSNDFYITSESYGGHYMPMLAYEIATHNDNHAINFKGFAVGNPYTDAFTNNVAQFDKFWGDQLIPKILYDPWAEKCRTPASRTAHEDFCNSAENQLNSLIGNLDPYGLDYDVCTTETAARGARTEIAWLLSHVSPWHLDIRVTFEPCEENFMVSYLNQAAVKQALHARTDLTWAECSTETQYHTADMQNPMMGYYNKLIDGKYNLKMLVYSGDDDSVCATVGTQDWIWTLGYKNINLWDVWNVDNQVAGYVTRFEHDLTFVTVHDAGHMVPEFRPARGLEVFRKYLDGTWFTAQQPPVIVLH